MSPRTHRAYHLGYPWHFCNEVVQLFAAAVLHQLRQGLRDWISH
ncbi:hypothetical protein GGQ85_000963 [Nitrobacter vulgaris]|jgi:hypothetical protein|nr:hypothetical protein [Nitrobacter vulgaris]